MSSTSNCQQIEAGIEECSNDPKLQAFSGLLAADSDKNIALNSASLKLFHFHLDKCNDTTTSGKVGINYPSDFAVQEGNMQEKASGAADLKYKNARISLLINNFIKMKKQIFQKNKNIPSSSAPSTQVTASILIEEAPTRLSPMPSLSFQVEVNRSVTEATESLNNAVKFDDSQQQLLQSSIVTTTSTNCLSNAPHSALAQSKSPDSISSSDTFSSPRHRSSQPTTDKGFCDASSSDYKDTGSHDVAVEDAELKRGDANYAPTGAHLDLLPPGFLSQDSPQRAALVDTKGKPRDVCHLCK